jgi:hypothetical protein
MEVLLQKQASASSTAKPSRRLSSQDRDRASALASALSQLTLALQDSLAFDSHDKDRETTTPATVHNTTDTTTTTLSTWLWDVCASLYESSVVALEPLTLVRAIWDASQESDEGQQQAALFDVFGASEESMSLLFELMPRLSAIQRIPLQVLLLPAHGNNDTSSLNDSSHVHHYDDTTTLQRTRLWQEAMDAAEAASLVRAELDALHSTTTGGVTHTVQRASDKKARKEATKAEKRAQQALKRAQQGMEDWRMDLSQAATPGTGGLAGNTTAAAWETVQASLLPEGSRQYYDMAQALPKGAIVEERGNIRKVTIPPAEIDRNKLHRRLPIHEIMDPVCAKAFSGADSLNPMQSLVFDVAFHQRENMLVCAPTGAGKTNVAMLAVVAHFRDVGLIPGGRDIPIEAGKKVVYIAPMKALAQEVVEKFSSKLKDLRLIVRELTGDMQLTRAESDSANVLVTTPEKWDVVTRKAGNEGNALGNQCGLLIIDEVHLVCCNV